MLKITLLFTILSLSASLFANEFQITGLAGTNLYVGFLKEDPSSTNGSMLIQYKKGSLPCASSSDCDSYEQKISKFSLMMSPADLLRYLEDTSKAWNACNEKYNNKCRYISSDFWAGDKQFLNNLSRQSKNLQLTILKAKEGSKEAQFELGESFRLGLDVNLNYSEAVKWYLLASKKNHAEAQLRLAWRYKKGQGVTQSDESAFFWWLKSAKLENKEAQDKTGYMYYHGYGTKKNDNLALFWYEKSARNKWPSGMFNYASMLDFGIGIERNLKKAIYWYEKSGAQGFGNANNSLCDIYLSDNEYSAFERCQIDHETALPKLLTAIGYEYEKNGNYPQALSLYKKAAGKEYPIAMYNLGVFYTKGRGVIIDYCEAIKWYELAAKHDFSPAIHNLANRYFNGDCVDKDQAKGLSLLKISAANGYQLSIDALKNH